MSLLDRITDLHPCNPDDYIPFIVDGIRVGQMKPEFRMALEIFPAVFDVHSDGVYLSSGLEGFDERNMAVAKVLETLREQGVVTGWRGELYPVGLNYHDPALIHMERAASDLFGIRTYGVNLHGYIREDQGVYLWIAKRSLSKETSPGKLDIVVGGGQPVGISLFENLIKECGEEASIPPSIAKGAILASETYFFTDRGDGIRNDLHYNYDLELPKGFEPQNTDGEVDAFYLWHTEQVIEVLSGSDDFAFDSALAIIDFLIRHNLIYQGHPDYTDLVTVLRPHTRLTPPTGTDL
jgi:hypothetical protein